MFAVSNKPADLAITCATQYRSGIIEFVQLFGDAAGGSPWLQQNSFACAAIAQQLRTAPAGFIEIERIASAKTPAHT
jgi:hypothetical protein